MNTTKNISTKNPTWGFHGTLGHNGIEGAAALFDEAARELMARLGLTEDDARDLLDARIGRHMANEIQHGETARDLVARLCSNQRWAREIKRAISRLRNEEPKDTATVTLRINLDEVPMLRYALEHALSSISEAHQEDRAQLKAFIARLEKAQNGARR